MQRCLGNLLNRLLPPLLALSAVLREAALSIWVQKHEATLLLVLFALVGSLLHPRLRYLMITTLCYGVSFLAMRDICLYFGQALPDPLDSHVLREMRPILLLVIAGLAFFAAVTESFKPGTILARRCYFGAAFLYFLGTGVINYFSSHSWQSIMLILTGIASFIGCCYAQQIVALEQEDEIGDDGSDLVLQQQIQEMHQRTLRAKEWHDRSEITQEEREALTPSAPTSQE